MSTPRMSATDFRANRLIAEARAERDKAEAERDELLATVAHMKEREQHFAKVLGVTDGGEYRNDWDSRLEGLLATVAELRQRCERLQAVIDRAYDAALEFEMDPANALVCVVVWLEPCATPDEALKEGSTP